MGIVGAGVMGSTVAREHAARGYSVVLCDTDPEALRNAASRWTGRSADIRCTLSLADLKGCDLILESIVEKRPAKQSLYDQLCASFGQGALLASNTRRDTDHAARVQFSASGSLLRNALLSPSSPAAIDRDHSGGRDFAQTVASICSRTDFAGKNTNAGQNDVASL